jgi:hypothetical protein
MLSVMSIEHCVAFLVAILSIIMLNEFHYAGYEEPL